MEIQDKTYQELIKTLQLCERWFDKLVLDKDFSPCDKHLCALLDVPRQRIKDTLYNTKKEII